MLGLTPSLALLLTFRVSYLEATSWRFTFITLLPNRNADDLCDEGFGEPTHLRVLLNCGGGDGAAIASDQQIATFGLDPSIPAPKSLEPALH